MRARRKDKRNTERAEAAVPGPAAGHQPPGEQRIYAAIDLKSFYASVECRERGLDPLQTFLVVADEARTDGTICLAASPALKQFGVPGRARLFEMKAKVREINAARRLRAPRRKLTGGTSNAEELARNPALALEVIIARPRMEKYLAYSRRIYELYLEFVAAEDIFAYSVDEVFCEVTSYLKYARATAREYVERMVARVFAETGITATAGIGTNLFLAKVAMDVIAKHVEADAKGLRVAELDQRSFREQLWGHRPLTDFWRIGPGTARKLERHQMRTLGEVAWCSLVNEELLFRLFGVNAELLIDHAWGVEPVGMAEVKNYRAESKSFSEGQVLPRAYGQAEAEVVVKEMAEALALRLTAERYDTDQLVLEVGYQAGSAKMAGGSKVVGGTKMAGGSEAAGGQSLPGRPVRGTLRLARATNSAQELMAGFLRLYRQASRAERGVRRLNLAAGNLQRVAERGRRMEQVSWLRDYAEEEPAGAGKELAQDSAGGFAAERSLEPGRDSAERCEELQKAVLQIRRRFGSNAIMRGVDFEPGATGRERRQQIGGHRA